MNVLLFCNLIERTRTRRRVLGPSVCTTGLSGIMLQHSYPVLNVGFLPSCSVSAPDVMSTVDGDGDKQDLPGSGEVSAALASPTARHAVSELQLADTSVHHWCPHLVDAESPF